MTGAPIARGLRLALVGLTATLLLVLAFAVAALYGARSDYEATLVRTYELETVAGQLRAAGVLEQAARTRKHPRGATGRASNAFERLIGDALSLAGGDPASSALVARRALLQRRLRSLGPAETVAESRRVGLKRADLATAARAATDALVARQEERRAQARDEVADETRAAAITAGAAAVLALLAALLLVRDFARRLRHPLDELVAATSRLAAGDFERTVASGGPREVRTLGHAFNAMAGDLRSARDRIEQERQKLSVTIESLGDGLVVCDAYGRVTAFNPRAAELIRGLVVGQPLDPEGGVLPETGEALAGEAMTESAGRSLAVTAARLDNGGGTVWTIRDVTERVRLERMKSDFVAAASHELRSPLTSIKGFIELLDRSPGLTGKQREATGIIRASTDRLVELVNDLLEVAQIEAGQLRLELAPTDVGDVVREAAGLLAPRIESRRQRLDLVAPADLPRACADPRRVRQIVENLLTNAHLYTAEDGHIEVECRDGGRDVAIVVSDDGRGLTPEELEHAFDRFYRGRQAGTLVPGSGLGLWIVRSLAELQGGSVEVESQVGAGATFTVRLPRATPQETDAPPAPAGAVAGLPAADA